MGKKEKKTLVNEQCDLMAIGQTAVEDTEAEIITESGIMGEGSDGDDEEEPNETEEDNKSELPSLLDATSFLFSIFP